MHKSSAQTKIAFCIRRHLNLLQKHANAKNSSGRIMMMHKDTLLSLDIYIYLFLSSFPKEIRMGWLSK
jgi:hypothetical protein